MDKLTDHELLVLINEENARLRADVARRQAELAEAYDELGQCCACRWEDEGKRQVEVCLAHTRLQAERAQMMAVVTAGLKGRALSYPQSPELTAALDALSAALKEEAGNGG